MIRRVGNIRGADQGCRWSRLFDDGGSDIGSAKLGPGPIADGKAKGGKPLREIPAGALVHKYAGPLVIFVRPREVRAPEKELGLFALRLPIVVCTVTVLDPCGMLVRLSPKNGRAAGKVIGSTPSVLPPRSQTKAQGA